MTDDPFVQRLKTLLVPALKQQRFEGKFPSLTRSIGQLIQQVTIAGSRRGGERSITLGIGFRFLDGFSAYEDGIEYYLPLSSEIAQDGWWKYNRESVTDCESRADNMIHSFHANADAFFINYSSFPGLFAELTMHDLEFAPTSVLPPRPFRNIARDCFVLMHLWNFLGQDNRAREFAVMGLQNVGNAAKLKSAFGNFLATATIE
jgi:hypothetical protein